MRGNSVHILLVEDAPDTAELIRELLEEGEEGVMVSIARDLKMARHILTEFCPDLVIADLLLPDGRGTELISGPKEEASYPIIILTGHGDQHAAVEAMKAGALDYVVKSGESLLDIPRIAGRALREWRHVCEHLRAEELLKRRTAELAAVNREMESFIYSVSHDLRAMLSGINGYSHLLLEDFTDQMPEEAVKYIDKIRTSSERMAGLIKSLSQLSQLARDRIEIEMLDLTHMAESIYESLRASQPTREVMFRAAPDIIALGDRRLVRVVLEGLIGNAWKFTSKTPNAKIEFGAKNTEKNTVYFVRDTGIGFDMASATKLFNPFHRLPNANGFEGDGLGLVSVMRVVHRHGGEVWAEAQPGEGATFYFTLPRSN